MSSHVINTIFRNKLTNRQLVMVGGLVVVGVLSGIGFWAMNNGVFNGQAALAGAAEEQADVADPGSQLMVMPVQVAPLEHISTFNQARTYTGTIRSAHQSEIAFEMTGRITDVRFDEGDRVKADDVLAMIDTSALLARQDMISADLERAKQVLSELMAGPRAEVIAAAEADVDSAEARLELATSTRNRNQNLVQSGGVSTLEFERSVFDFEAATAALEAANQRLDELNNGTRPEKKDAQRAAVMALEASLRELDVSIEKSSIEAPFDGVVSRRFNDEGTIATPGAPIFRLVDDRNLEAWVGLPVDVAGGVAVDSEYPLSVEGFSVKVRCFAKISEIDPATRTQTVLFKVLEDEQTGEVPPVVSGQLCEIEVANRVAASGFWIPNEALTSGVRGLWAVYVAVQTEDGWKAQRRDVEVIKTDVGRSLCEGVLTDGELLIVGGLHKITHDQSITFEQN